MWKGILFLILGIVLLYVLFMNIKKEGFMGEGITSMDFRMNFGFLISGIGFILIGILHFFMD